jgi:L-fuculose-phosphate aldolase
LATSERLAQKPQTQTKSKKANAAPVVELAPFWYQENELSPDWVKVIPETEESRREQKTLRIKQELANSMKELFENKMIALRDGNVSMKPKGEDRFFITPGGVPKNTLKPEDVCEIPMDVEYTPPKKTGPRPSRETFMHKSVYMAFRERLDANKDMFVVHAHPPAILAYVGVEEGRKKQLSSLKSLFPEFLTTIGPNVPLLEAGSKDLADTCGANVQGVDLIVLENHGTISVGETLQEAMEALETVEYYASIANNAGLTPMPSLALQQPLQ